MSIDSRRRKEQSIPAEISLVHLHNCLVNLPASISSLLTNVNTLAQNVIVELNYRTHTPGPVSSNNNSPLRSVYVGWTGLQSSRRLAPIFDKHGSNGLRSLHDGEGDQEVQLVELDYTFARTLQIVDGHKVTASLHLDPPVAQTVYIEPLTVEDWEIIELHAKFLELNLISQIRALPNPKYVPQNQLKSNIHPLTLKLSPTSTANIQINSLTPEPPSNSPFAKLDPNAEIIVAPKTRAKSPRSHGDNRSTTSRKSAGGRKKGAREESRQAIYFRGVERCFYQDSFENTQDSEAQSLKVWVDRDVILSKGLIGVTWVLVTVLKPKNLLPPVDPQKQQQDKENLGLANPIASRVVARLLVWEDPPDSQHIALSKSVCISLVCEGMVGGIVKLEPAPQQIFKNVSSDLNEDEIQSTKFGPRVIKIYPFSLEKSKIVEGLKFGGEAKAATEEAARRIMKIFRDQTQNDSLFDGPVTDGMILGKTAKNDQSSGWEGGILRFEHPPVEAGRQACHWFLGSGLKFLVKVQPSIPRPSFDYISEPLPPEVSSLVGIDSLIDQVQANLLHLSSVLLTGAQGSGKTSLAQLLAHRLKTSALFHVTYFSCRKAILNGSRVSTIKETFNQIFLSASWGARLGGRSLVILDDLDKLCPAETELETSENGRSRQISEGLCIVARKYCSMDSGVVLFATTQTKESLHNVIIGGHILRETLALKSPNKIDRGKVIELVSMQSLRDSESKASHKLADNLNVRPLTAEISAENNSRSWMESSSETCRIGLSKTFHDDGGFTVSPDLDFLDLAGETDGYMPGDLIRLVTRARSEAIIRAVSEDSTSTRNSIEIKRIDFTRAISGFTPASLRNVTLQKSTTTFESIGGLHATRRILLETLQYPTIYAPIFAQCPLRLRSGILLYGYPGCGKTLLASVVAGEFGLNFISVKGPEILNKYIGASEKSVRDLFERAEAAKPCILFFDEFDSIAPKRGHDSTGVTDRVVNQILTQMDGAEGLSGVYVLAATSRPDLIDPALLRPGRLDKSLICDLPDEEDRIDILTKICTKLKLSHEARNNLPEIACHTEGYSGADLQALIYNAHLEAIHDLLGDKDDTDTGHKKNQINGKMPTCSTRGFFQFRYGEEEERLDIESSKKFNNSSKMLAEKAAISNMLAEIRMRKRQLRIKVMNQDDDSMLKVQKQEEKEAIIQWRHFVKSLSTTKASISADERNRLRVIYSEFLTARDGEVRSGDGGREVGGRVSLM
ncbi:hypothetical protein Golomagni_03780 [Golovinomyces magnicellulatus]|nr:hypothetical protein Golomagni_03780 [Golovinomyces magnicellulatus]